MKQIAKQEARDRYLESLKPKKATELQEEVGEKARDSVSNFSNFQVA